MKLTKTINYMNLKITIDYKKIMDNIDKEIKNPFYKNLEYCKNKKYTFNIQNISDKDYINSLKGMKNILKDYFSENRNKDIFSLIPLINNLFSNNLNDYIISSVTTGIIIELNNKTMIKIPVLRLITHVDIAVLEFSYIDINYNELNPIFIGDDINKHKNEIIPEIDLKPGYIYSTKNKESYFLYLGKPYLINDYGHYGYAFKTSDKPITFDDFTEEYISKQADMNYKVNPQYFKNRYIYLPLTKNKVNELKNTPIKFEHYIKNVFMYSSEYFDFSNTLLDFYNEEFEFLTQFKKRDIIEKEEIIPVSHIHKNVYVCKYILVRYK